MRSLTFADKALRVEKHSSAPLGLLINTILKIKCLQGTISVAPLVQSTGDEREKFYDIETCSLSS